MQVKRVVFNNAVLPKKKNVCAYARVSVNDDEMLHSLNNQIQFYKEYILSHPEWNFVGVFHDKPTTGTKADREQFQNMLQLCRNGEIDLIITKTISRFARNTVTTLQCTRELKALGIDVYFENENIHTLSAEGELMLSLCAAYAQAESLSVSENCKWRIQKKFENGEITPFSILGYDRQGSVLSINETEATIIRQIFERYIKGDGFNKIANDLNALGYRSKNGTPFDNSKIKRILTNEKYAGHLLLQKTFRVDHLCKTQKRNKGEQTQYFVEGNHDAIVSDDTYKTAISELSKRAERYAPRKQADEYAFTGLIKCGICGGSYRRKLNAAGTKYEKPVWICNTYNTKGKNACPSHFIPESILLEKTLELLGTDDISTIQKSISSITAYNNNRLVFVLQNGVQHDIIWQHKSRSQSWTPEMKQKAREARYAKCSSY